MSAPVPLPCSYCGNTPASRFSRAKTLQYRCRNKACYLYRAGWRGLERWNEVQEQRERAIQACNTRAVNPGERK